MSTPYSFCYNIFIHASKYVSLSIYYCDCDLDIKHSWSNLKALQLKNGISNEGSE